MLAPSKEVCPVTQQEYLELIDDVISKGKYKDNWESLSGHKTPAWYYRDKLGIFIHWGIYSVPGYGNEWYSRGMYDINHREFGYHVTHYGNQKDFGYKDFIPMFKGEYFSAEKWVSLFKEAGAKFVMPVCEHHDGFAMYKTEFNRWNAAEMGPCRDVAGEIKAECEKQGLTFCASTHRAEHYFFMNPGRSFDSDVNDDRYSDFYGPAVLCPEFESDAIHKTTADTFATGASKEWLEDWLVRTCELIDSYQPSILYFDWWIHNHSFKPYLKKLCAYYYNRAEEWGKEVTINYKHEAFPPTVATFDVERGALTDISPVPWQTDTAIGKESWGYRKDNHYKSARQIITDLIDIVSKNGMLLLNIGPKADGTITDEETAVLREIGKWMGLNGDGIYGTTFWKKFGEGEVNNEAGFFKDGDEKQYTAKDFRFTYKNGCIYAFQMRPDGNDAVINSLRQHESHNYIVKNVTLLSSGEKLDFDRTQDGLIIRANSNFSSDLPLCFKVEID
ncbi:MAG: alpha-L-fucosidase [Clostridia bacterium]|nr:alpha-L-fucosidase [Clostridia bacterium]